MPQGTHPCPGGCGCKVADAQYYCAACAAYRKPGPGKPKGSKLPGEAARGRPPVVEADPGATMPAPDVRACTNPTNNPNCKGVVGAYSKTGLCQSCAVKAARAKKKWSGNRRGHRRKPPRAAVAPPPAKAPAGQRKTTRRKAPARVASPATPPTEPIPAPPSPAEPAPASTMALVPAADPLATRDVVLAAVERVVHGFPEDAELDVRVRIRKGHMSLKADLEIP